MPLKLPPGFSRFKRNESEPMPMEAVAAFREVINQIAAQGQTKRIYEHFKRYFSGVAGNEYFPSSDEGWASSDLSSAMDAAAASPPLFLSALYDAIEALRGKNDYDLPEVADLNEICRGANVGFLIDPPAVVALRTYRQPAATAAAAPAPATPHARPAPPASAAGESRPQQLPDHFDVAITYAGSDRAVAKDIADRLVSRGLVVFYDRYYPEHLLGEDLAETFDNIFRHRASFCVMLISKAYADREWTRHERRSALARAVVEKGKAYILPLRLDSTELPGLPPTLGHLSFDEHDAAEVAEIIYRKVRAATRGA